MANPNIFAQFARPRRTVADRWAEQDQQEMRALQIEGARRTAGVEEMNAAQRMGQAQRAEEERNALAAILRDSGGDEEATMRALRSSGYAGLVDRAAAMAKDRTERDKTAAEIAAKQAATKKSEEDTRKGEQERQIAARSEALRQLMLMQGPEEAAQAIGQDQALPQPVRESLLRTVPQDPAAFDQWKVRMYLLATDPKLTLPKTETRDSGGSVEALRFDPVSGEMSVVGSIAKTQSPDNKASNERAEAIARANREQQAREAAAGRAVTMRGQNMSDARARETAALKAGPETTPKPLPAGALKMQTESLDAIGVASSISADLRAIEKQIDGGKLTFGPVANAINTGRNMAGMSTEESRNFGTFKSSLERLRNESLRLNAGVQTEGDAQRAWGELFQSINDKSLVKQRLGEIQRINKRAVELQKLKIDSVRANYGHSPLDTESFETQPPAVGGKPSVSGW